MHRTRDYVAGFPSYKQQAKEKDMGSTCLWRCLREPEHREYTHMHTHTYVLIHRAQRRTHTLTHMYIKCTRAHMHTHGHSDPRQPRGTHAGGHGLACWQYLETSRQAGGEARPFLQKWIWILKGTDRGCLHGCLRPVRRLAGDCHQRNGFAVTSGRTQNSTARDGPFLIRQPGSEAPF